jgi:hypothetical protein
MAANLPIMAAKNLRGWTWPTDDSSMPQVSGGRKEVKVLLTIAEVAQRECKPISTVLDWIEQGLATKEGPDEVEFIDLDDLTEFLKSKREEPETDDDEEDEEDEEDED